MSRSRECLSALPHTTRSLLVPARDRTQHQSPRPTQARAHPPPAPASPHPPTHQRSWLGSTCVGAALFRMGPAGHELPLIAVEPAHRGRGVGRALVGIIRHICAQPPSGRREIVASVPESAKACLGFWGRLGFAKVRGDVAAWTPYAAEHILGMRATLGPEDRAPCPLPPAEAAAAAAADTPTEPPSKAARGGAGCSKRGGADLPLLSDEPNVPQVGTIIGLWSLHDEVHHPVLVTGLRALPMPKQKKASAEPPRPSYALNVRTLSCASLGSSPSSLGSSPSSLAAGPNDELSVPSISLLRITQRMAGETEAHAPLVGGAEGTSR